MPGKGLVRVRVGLVFAFGSAVRKIPYWHFIESQMMKHFKHCFVFVFLLQKQKDEPMIMTSLLTFKVLAKHHNQRVTCNVSYPLTTGGSKQSSKTTQPLNVQCETLTVCPKVPVFMCS